MPSQELELLQGWMLDERCLVPGLVKFFDQNVVFNKWVLVGVSGSFGCFGSGLWFGCSGCHYCHSNAKVDDGRVHASDTGRSSPFNQHYQTS